jgi:hypothetical protein
MKRPDRIAVLPGLNLFTQFPQSFRRRREELRALNHVHRRNAVVFAS